MKRITDRLGGCRLLIAALLVAALVPAAAAGAAKPRAEFTRYKVEVTGIVVDDWQYQSRGWGKGGPGARGSGTQTIGFSTRGPESFQGVATYGSAAGLELDGFSMAPLRALKPLRGSITRRGSWRTDDGIPVCEGGPQYCPDEGPGPQPTFQCPRLKPNLVYRLQADSDDGAPRLRLEVDLPSRPYENCHPDHYRSLELAANLPIRELWDAAAIKKLRRGQKKTLRDSGELFLDNRFGKKQERRCRKNWDVGPGFKQCVTYDYTVEIRRTR